MKLVQAKNYLLLIDENAELLCGDAIIDNVGRVWDKPYTEKCFVDVMKTHDDSHKIVAYYPLNKDCKELDLPMLPDPLYDENLEKRSILAAQQYAIDKSQDSMASLTKMAVAWKNGFETALTVKQFTLEDIQKAIHMGSMMSELIINPTTTIQQIIEHYKNQEEKIIQFITASKLPTEFIPNVFYRGTKGDILNEEKYNLLPIEQKTYWSKPIFESNNNSEGKEVLVGTYKY